MGTGSNLDIKNDEIMKDSLWNQRQLIVSLPISVKIIYHLILGILIDEDIRRTSPEVTAVFHVTDGLVVVRGSVSTHNSQSLTRITLLVHLFQNQLQL